MTNTTKQISTCVLQLGQEQNEDEFKLAIIETVDESLSSFSKVDKQAVYFQLENTFNIEKEEIPSKLEGFADAIEQMFGIGAKMIEIRIIEAIHKRIPEFVFFPKKGDIDFKEYAASLQVFLVHTL